MKGTLLRLPDGTLTARLTDAWGYVHVLTGTKTEAGYDVEVRLVGIPDELWLLGDDELFEISKGEAV